MSQVEIITLLLTCLLVIMFLTYYIWVAVLVTKQHQDLEVSHTSQRACIKSPLEIETTRYQSIRLHKDYNPEDYDHIDVAEAKFKNQNVVFGMFSAILLAGSIGLAITSRVNDFPLFGINMILCITTLILTVALFTNNFTENKVIKEYMDTYKVLKQRLDGVILHTTNAGTGEIKTNISKLEDLPEDLTASLVQRYSAYHEITNYFKMPVYSEYEMYQKVKDKLEKPLGSGTEIRLDELMRFLKFNYDNDRVDLKTDMDILVGDDVTANRYKTLAGNKFDPYESLKKQYINIITALIIIITLIIYYIFHSIYTETNQVGLLVTVISLLVFVMVVILMVYRFTL